MKRTREIRDRGWLRQDIPQLVEMMVRLGEEYDPSANWSTRTAKTKRWLLSTFNLPQYYFHVVRSGEILVAMAGLAGSGITGYGGHLHSVYVEPAHRQRGYGRLVTEKVIEYARDLGLSTIEMGVTHNPVARLMYESLGFTMDAKNSCMVLQLASTRD